MERYPLSRLVRQDKKGGKDTGRQVCTAVLILTGEKVFFSFADLGHLIKPRKNAKNISGFCGMNPFSDTESPLISAALCAFSALSDGWNCAELQNPLELG